MQSMEGAGEILDVDGPVDLFMRGELNVMTLALPYPCLSFFSGLITHVHMIHLKGKSIYCRAACVNDRQNIGELLSQFICVSFLWKILLSRQVHDHEIERN